MVDVPACKCWECGYAADAATGIGEAEMPTPGDYGICINCGQLSIYAEDLTRRMPTDDEFCEATKVPEIQAARKAINKYNKSSRSETMSTPEWRSIDTAPLGVEVDTKIDDADGCRNEQTLIGQRRDPTCRTMWFFPDFSMYVYYTPTHWRPVQSPAGSAQPERDHEHA